ncbi:MAG: acyl-CoA dehydrogenase, partial [Gammaproteobacteria bacterium]
GMGYIEETGAAQYFRDARISTIYEGTTGIQAKDLIGRKIARDQGATAKGLIAEMRRLDAELAKAQGEDLKIIRTRLSDGINALEESINWLVKNYTADVKIAAAGSVPFLMLLGTVAGGWQMARAALIAQKRLADGTGDASFYKAKIGTARFYAGHELTKAPALKESIVAGAAGVLALSEDQF